MSAKNVRGKRRCSRGKGERVHAYLCPFCGGYHVGHPPKRVRQAIAARRTARRAVR